MIGRDSKGKFLSGIHHPMKTEQLRKQSSESHKGQTPWNKGKTGLQKCSEETKLKMSLVHIGKNSGEKNGMYGRPAWNKGKTGVYSEESLMKFRISRRHRIIPRKDTKPEKIMQIALKLQGIRYEKHKPIIGQPDIFIEANLCVFIDGDYWHANPEKYKARTIMRKTKSRITHAKDIWIKDKKTSAKLKYSGYEVIRFWESDIKKDANKCVEIIKQKYRELTCDNI